MKDELENMFQSGEVELIVRKNGKEGKSRIALESLQDLQALHGDDARNVALVTMFDAAWKDVNE